MTTLADTPDWLANWQASNRDKVEAGAARAAQQAAQREARAASTPKREATPKPRTAPAQPARAPIRKLLYPAGRAPYSHAP